MNNNIYRTIFCQVKNQVVVVAETTRSRSQSPRNRACAGSLPGRGGVVAIKEMVLGILLAIYTSQALASQIVADIRSPASQQPTILSGTNGVPLVNIQTPSAGGVSRNSYSQFDISQLGVVLNNSRQSNPWLAGGEARVILNEIHSSQPSKLEGLIGIQGSGAELIIANPAGIQVNGARFSNANSVMLTTGKGRFNGGELAGYSIDGGQIQIAGRGLDVSDTPYTTLLAKAVAVQAELKAKQLSIVAGKSELDAVDGKISAAVDGGGASALAIDVGSLGGMYAGKIQLWLTDDGAGLKNAGTLNAGDGLLAIQAQGKVDSSGKLMGGVITAESALSDIVNSGELSAKKVLALAAGKDLQLAGGMPVSAGDSIVLRADGQLDLRDNIRTTGAASVIDVSAGKDMRLDHGSLNAVGDIQLNAGGTIHLESSQIIADQGDVLLLAEQGIQAAGGGLIGGKVHLETGKPFVETSASIRLSDTVLAARTQSNLFASGDVRLQGGNNSLLNGSGNAHIEARQNLTVDAGVQLVGTGDLTLNAGKHLALGGEDQTTQLQAQSVRLNAGDIAISGAKLKSQAGDLTLIADTSLKLEGSKGRAAALDAAASLNLGSGGDMELNGVQMVAENVNVSSLGQLTLSGGGLSNQLKAKDGVQLYAQQGMSLGGGARSRIEAGGNVLAQAGVGALAVRDGDIQAGVVAQVIGMGDVTLADSALKGDSLLVKSQAGQLTLANSSLSALRAGKTALERSGSLSLEADKSFAMDNASRVEAQHDLTIQVENGNLALNADKRISARNRMGLLAKNGTLTLEETSGENVIRSAAGVDLIAGNVTVNAVSLESEQDMRVLALNGKVEFNNGAKDGSSAQKKYLDYQNARLHELDAKVDKVWRDFIQTQRYRDLQARFTDGSWSRELEKLAVESPIGEEPILVMAETIRDNKLDLESAFGETEIGEHPTGVRNLFNRAWDNHNRVIQLELNQPIAYLKENRNKLASLVGFAGQPGSFAGFKNSALKARDIEIVAADSVEMDGVQAEAGGDLAIKALGGGIQIAGTVNSFEQGDQNSDNFRWGTFTLSSRLVAGKQLSLQHAGATDGLIQLAAVDLKAGGGISLSGSGNIAINSGKDETYSYQFSERTSGGWLNKKTERETRVEHRVYPHVTSLAAPRVTVASNGNIDAYGALFDAPKGSIQVSAGKALSFWAVDAQDFSKTDIQVSRRKFTSLITGALGGPKHKESSSSTVSQINALPSRLISGDIDTGSGWDTRLQGTVFETSLSGATIQAGVGPQARPDAKIILEGAQNTLSVTRSSESKSIVWQKIANSGSVDQTLTMPTFFGPKPPSFSAPGGLAAHIPAGELRQQIQNLSSQPGLGYLQVLAERKDIQWQPIQLMHEKWDYKHEGLTAEGAALVAIAVAVATGPGGVATLSGVATSAGLSGTYATMATAAMASLASQASVHFINNKGDMGKTLNAMGRSSTVKASVTAALTAGVLDKLGGTQLMQQWGGDQALIHQKLAFNMVNAGSGAVVNAAINGGDLDQALKTALIAALATTAHGEAASQIKLLENKVILHKIAHAAAGCAAAAAQSKACRDGAIGAAVGEMVAEIMLPGRDITLESDRYQITEFSKLVAGGVVAVAGGDVGVATQAAEIAVKENSLRLVKFGWTFAKASAKSWMKHGKVSWKDVKGALKEDVASLVENVITLTDGQLELDDAFAIAEIASGLDLKKFDIKVAKQQLIWLNDRMKGLPVDYAKAVFGKNTPVDLVAEQAVKLGGKVMSKGRLSDLMDAAPACISKGGCVSKGKMLEHGIELAPDARDMELIRAASRVGVPGDVTEMLMERIAKREGMSSLFGKYGSDNGFDGVFFKTGKDGSVLIVDAKPVRNMSTKLQKGAGGFTQLSPKWVETVLDNLDRARLGASNPAIKAELNKTIELVSKAHSQGKIATAIMGVDKASQKVVVVPVMVGLK